MKNFITTMFLFLFLNTLSAQIEQTEGITFDVLSSNTRSITQGILIDARTINDIQPGFPSSWISSYVSMEIVTSFNGEVMKAESVNDQLSDEQIRILNLANAGSDINIEVAYYPENTLENNDVKKIHYSFKVVPKYEAEYPGGYELLKEYLQESAIDKIPENIAGRLPQTIISFIINEKGQVNQVEISNSSQDDATDELLLEAISNMPNWTPAQNSDGTYIEQGFEFSVGNMIGC